MFFIVMEISVSVSFFSSFLYRHSWREWKMMKDGSLSRSEGRGKGGVDACSRVAVLQKDDRFFVDVELPLLLLDR